MPDLRTIGRTLASARQVGWRRRRLIAEAAFWLLASRLALVFAPFPMIARRLGAFVPPADPRVAAGAAPAAPEQAQIAREIGWAVTRGAAHVPFKAVCLPQAMAARIMLKPPRRRQRHALRRRAWDRRSRSTPTPGSMPRASG